MDGEKRVGRKIEEERGDTPPPERVQWGRRTVKHELGGRRGMLISDFPFVRSVHLLGKRLFDALFPLYGWMATDEGKR